MKTLKEIQGMLVVELYSHIEDMQIADRSLEYFNNVLGDTSFLLAGFLNLLLRNKFKDWHNKKWIDDSLIKKVELKDKKMSLWGFMIWGISAGTEQWVEPFHFEVDLHKNIKDEMNYTFKFGDKEHLSINYTVFNRNRNYCNFEIKQWKYEFKG